ncbi:MAG: hypothetical protein ACRDU7_07580 [Acidimicrobiia bacterium]
MTLGDRPTDRDGSRPIEKWSDEELVAEYRYIKGELADSDYRDSDDAPARAVEGEMKSRGLTPDREDVIPDAGSPRREPGASV